MDGNIFPVACAGGEHEKADDCSSTVRNGSSVEQVVTWLRDDGDVFHMDDTDLGILHSLSITGTFVSSGCPVISLFT